MINNIMIKNNQKVTTKWMQFILKEITQILQQVGTTSN